MSVITAPVTNISRCSLHDGPGIRTVVYLKGCPLHCAWCHNPETIEKAPVILYLPNKCIGCGRCLSVCPNQCHQDAQGVHLFDRSACTVCSACAQACPALALSLCGEEMTVDAVMKVLKRDAHFYQRSGGGVTISGGECLLHPEFTASLLRACKEEGFHTCIETALFVSRTALEQVMPFVDLFFCDCKLADSEKHRLYTGAPNEVILDNIRFLSASGSEIILRIPMIPGVNDTDEELARFAERIPTLGVKRVELLRYNDLGASKYEIAGMPPPAIEGSPQTPEEMEHRRAFLAERMEGIEVLPIA